MVFLRFAGQHAPPPAVATSDHGHLMTSKVLDPRTRKSRLVGPKGIAERFGRGYVWARDLLKEWAAEDERTGRSPPRTLRCKGRGGKLTLYTTIAVLNAHAPPARDEEMAKHVRNLERELDAFARRITQRLDAIDATLRKLERARR